MKIAGFNFDPLINANAEAQWRPAAIGRVLLRLAISSMLLN